MGKRPASRSKGKGGQYFQLPHTLLNSPMWAGLPFSAKALFLEFGAQYNGYNNGDLHCAWSLLKKRGWRSSATLAKAKKKLLDVGLIHETRSGLFLSGGHSRPALYAIAYLPINECKGKDLEVRHPNNIPHHSLLEIINGSTSSKNEPTSVQKMNRNVAEFPISGSENESTSVQIMNRKTGF